MNHLVYCGNRKGELNIYDVRTHKKLHKLTAHESCIKAVALDPDEYYLATGSSEGNIKVKIRLFSFYFRLSWLYLFLKQNFQQQQQQKKIWNVKTLESVQTYHNEHSKSSLIRSFSSGVNQLYFTNDNQLLSCGTDGTLVIRNLPSHK